MTGTPQPYNTTMSQPQLIQAIAKDIAALYAAIAAITVPAGANPSAKVGLNAVNGAAATFMRSDAAPPIDVTINVTWTGAQIFTPSGAATAITLNGAAGAAQALLVTAANGQSCAQFNGTGGGAALRIASGTVQGFYIQNSAQGVGTASMRIDSAATTGSKTASFTSSNKPGTNNQTTPAQWLPVNLDGVLYYVPAFAA